MKNIDFLPSRYRVHAAAKTAQWWRLVVIGLFGSGIGLASLFQWTIQRAVNADLAIANLQYEEAQLQERRLASAQENAQLGDREAELHAYLQHPWPRTQMLHALASFVPEPVVLKNVRIGHKGQGDGARKVINPNIEQAQSEAAKISPPERDLNRLREENDEQRVLIEVEGATADLAALHSYVAHLAQSPLFERAELLSLEGGTNDGPATVEKQGSSFKLRVTVKFGYGQTRGPTTSTVAATPEASGKG